MKETIKQIVSLKRGILTSTLFVSGAIVVVLPIFRIPFFSGIVPDPIQTAMLYFVFGLIAMAIAIERATDLYQIQESLKKQTEATDKINDAIRRLKVYESLDTKDEIYESALKLIDKAGTVIRSIVFAKESKVPSDWNQKLAEVLKNRKAMGRPIDFKLVLCFQKQSLSEQTFREARKIYNLFRENGVATMYIRYIHILEGGAGAIGPDMLIIDNGYAIFNFATLAPTSGFETHKGIQFSEQTEMTKNLIDWFDNHVSHGAKKFEVVCKEHMERLIPNQSDAKGSCPEENCAGRCWRLD